ncbi:hypothetical protein NQL31_003709 [Lotmaria passim]
MIQLCTFSYTVIVRWKHLHALVSGNASDVLHVPYASASAAWPSYRLWQSVNSASLLHKTYADVKGLIMNTSDFHVSFGIHGDNVKLHRDYPQIAAASVVELTTLAEACLPDAVVDCSQQWPASEPDVVRADSLQSLKKLCAALTGKALGKDKCVVMSDWGGCHGAVSPLQMEYGAEDAEASCDACAAILRGGGFLRHGELANSGGDWAHVGCTVECSHGPRLPRGAGLLHGHRRKRSR